MSITMFQASVPVVIYNLHSLSKILAKAQAELCKDELEEKSLLASRLAPDMFCLIEQLRFILLHAKLTAAKLANTDIPVLADNEGKEETIQEIQDNLAKTISHLKTFKASQIDGSEMNAVELVNFSNETVKFTGQKFLLGFALPNFFFHYSMAYGILRNRGLEIGKHDFLGATA